MVGLITLQRDLLLNRTTAVGLLATIFALLLVTDSFSQQSEKAEQQAEVVPTLVVEPDNFEISQLRILRKELNRLPNSVGLGEYKFSEELKKQIREFKGNRETNGAGYLCHLRQPIREAAWDELRAAANKDSIVELEAYITEAELMVDRHNSEAVKCFVVFLDNHLFLTEEQANQLEKTLTVDWNEDNNFTAYLLTFRSLRAKQVLDSVNRDAIKKILNQDQQKLFMRFEELAVDIHTMLENAEPKELDFDKPAALIHSNMEALITELTKYQQLTEKDQRILAVAGKGATKTMRSQWQLAATDLTTLESQRLFTTPLTFQLARHRVINKKIKSMLGDQFERFEAERMRRQKTRTRRSVIYLLYYYENLCNLRIPSAQHTAIVDAICKKLDQLDYVDFKTVTKAIESQSDAIYEENLSEDDYEKWKGVVK